MSSKKNQSTSSGDVKSTKYKKKSTSRVSKKKSNKKSTSSTSPVVKKKSNKSKKKSTLRVSKKKSINKSTSSTSPVSKKKSSKEKKVDITKEPKYIQGPVNFIYLEGDAGDGIVRKVLLLGDVHEPHTPCSANKGIGLQSGEASIANFCRYIAHRIAPKIIDVFIEEYYDLDNTRSKLYSDRYLVEGDYLNNLCVDFKDCLLTDKSKCKEPLRVHYVDVRFIDQKEQLSSLFLMYNLLLLTRRSFAYSKEDCDKAEWPDSEDVEDVAKANLLSGKLTSKKIKSIDSSIKQKFKDIIITPVLERIISFYRSKTNKESFKLIKKIRTNTIFTKKSSITTKDFQIVQEFENRLNHVRSFIVDAYFVYRLLKRATARKPDRHKVALKVGEPTTRVIGYEGSSHVFQTSDMLVKLGFKIIAQEDKNGMEKEVRQQIMATKIVQCLPYKAIKDSIDRFCTNEKKESTQKISKGKKESSDSPVKIKIKKESTSPIKDKKKSSKSKKTKESTSPIKDKKKSIGLKLLEEAKTIIEKKTTYIKFWAYIASRLYIKNMIKEDKYTVDDLKTYDLKKDLKSKEIVLDAIGALTEFYRLYEPNKGSKEINDIVTKYKTWYSVLLQRLYKKYIDSNFEVDKDQNSYPDIVIL